MVARTSFNLRAARPEDAITIIELMKSLATEDGVYVSYTVEEAARPVEKEAERIRNITDDFYIVAEVNDRVVGDFCINRDRWKLTGHVAYLGMGIMKDYRNRGIGNAMMREGLDWARRAGDIKKIELEVFTENQPAVQLYTKFGFEVEGRKRSAVLKWGRFMDTYIMGLLL